MKSFPKIFAIGDRHIQKLFEGPVEITEKIDGSQFVFGIVDNELKCRSKGKMIEMDAPDKMFQPAVDVIRELPLLGMEDELYYCEYMRKPKHNSISYDNTPKNHLALFGIMDAGGVFVNSYEALKNTAEFIGIDVAPLVFHGEVKDPAEIIELQKRESYLGGAEIEGVVVKNYAHEFFIADRLHPIMCGKYVSEKFKEKHQHEWKKGTGKGQWEVFIEGFRTDARWEKAIQHLRDKGELEGSPRDIGKLIKEVQGDIIEEEKENITQFLWNTYNGHLLRKSIAGLPEWYKERLLMGAE